MAPLSRKARLQQFSWQVLDDLAFCSERYPRLAELAAQLLCEHQADRPPLSCRTIQNWKRFITGRHNSRRPPVFRRVGCI